jgi:hypothetical protein
MCKFGVLCFNPNCAYQHPNLPPKNKLKWTASPTITSSAGSMAVTSVQSTSTGSQSIAAEDHISENNQQIVS